MTPVLFAVLAALVFGLWTVFHELAAPHINQVFGAVLVSLSAVVAGSIVLIPQLKGMQLVSDPKGIYFVILAGICAFLIDFLTLSAYAKGLSVNIGGPIIIGGSIAVAGAIGFLMGDPVTVPKILGLVLVMAGAIILSMTTA